MAHVLSELMDDGTQDLSAVLKDINSEASYSKPMDANGTFCMDEIPDGEYEVRIGGLKDGAANFCGRVKISEGVVSEIR